MRIYRMTATFGKLQHETLTLEPGLNVITAPNEWGKSTWCAFLVAMLYGLDTRAKTTRNILADKDHYAPWSGAPMSGRIDLNWNGRDITIERNTTQRVPMGDFRAYETETGIPVEELNADNCGQLLLGVEQSVFRRAGFIRHVDLPVTQDEALRRRLNALVATGDDSGGAEMLAQELKDLKNRCRYNKSGLLPQAEQERDVLQNQIAELDQLSAKSATLQKQLGEIKSWLAQLYNHQTALAYEAAKDHAARLAQAKEEAASAAERLELCRSQCAELPPREEAEKRLRELRSFREDWNAILQEQEQASKSPQEPLLPAPFEGMTDEDAEAMAQRDARRFAELGGNRGQGLLIAVGIIGGLAAAGLAYMAAYIFAGIAGAISAIALVWGVTDKITVRSRTKRLLQKYGSDNPKRWADPIWKYREELEQYQAELKDYKDVAGDLEVRMLVLNKRRDSLCGDQTPEERIEFWQRAAAKWDVYDAASREDAQARRHVQTLAAMVKPAKAPQMPDSMTQSEAETTRLLSECALEQQRLQNRLGQYQGRMAVLGDPDSLKKLLKEKNARIASLEDTYTALTIAQQTLEQATEELQRRFAPRITKRAQKLLTRLTGGRYRSLVMTPDFSLETGSEQEDTLRSSMWRSDGTADQLYLALRLAVAQELTPDAPLVLDDCLVLFDDERMEAAVRLLRELGEEKQILLFTCQGREANVKV